MSEAIGSTSFSIDFQEYIPKTPGVYIGEVVDVEFRTGDYGDYLLFQFALKAGPDEGFISATCSAKLTPKTKLFSWMKALTRKDEDFIKTTGKLNEKMLAGRYGKLVIQHVTNKEGYVTDKVTDILPVTDDELASLTTGSAAVPRDEHVAIGAFPK